MLDLAYEVAKLQGRLVLFTFLQKSHSSLVLNTEHNGVVHRRVVSTCSCEHAWCNEIRYGWNLCWYKILNTDRRLIPPFFSICVLLTCGFAAAEAKIAAALFSLTINPRLTRVCFTVPKRQKRSANRLKAMCDFCWHPDNKPHTNLGRFCNVYGIPPALSTYKNIFENRSFSRFDVLTLEGNAWLTDMSTENAYFLPVSTIPYQCVLSWVSYEMKIIFRLFSYFAWLEWPCVVGHWIRLKIGNNVIEKKKWFHLKKWCWPWRSFSACTDKKIGWSSMAAFSNTETFVWNIFGYDQ